MSGVRVHVDVTRVHVFAWLLGWNSSNAATAAGTGKGKD